MSALAPSRPRTPARLATALASLWLAVASGWAPNLRAEISPDTRWADPSHVKLGVDFPGDGYHADWELFRCECGDLLVRSELNMPGEVEAGETLLVGGRAVLSRGFAREPELGSSLDAPALMMQLALRLLERAEPGGPARITEARAIEVLEETSPIELESYSAVGGFKAPWALKASIEPAGEARRRFDLRFEFSVGAGSDVQRGSMRLKGVADYAVLEFPLAGSASLEKWTLSWRGEDEPAELAAKKPETLDDLRTLLRNQ